MLDLIRLQQLPYMAREEGSHCSADEANSRIAAKLLYGKWYYAPKSPDMPLFWSGNYRKLTRSGITYIVQKYAAAAQAISTDIPATISPHVFRHTKAMHLVQANVNTIYIKDYLGHADISTTEVYARADNEAKRAALEKASLCLELPCASNWEQDADLIAWLSSLG